MSGLMGSFCSLDEVPSLALSLASCAEVVLLTSRIIGKLQVWEFVVTLRRVLENEESLICLAH